MSSYTPKQSLVLDEDSNLWLTIEEPLDGFQEAMGVNFENQGRKRRHIFETDSLRRDRREISNASNAISELSLSIKYGSELSQDSVQQHSIDFLPHQLRPLALFQDKAGREGMLIADEVGTGKTYSAGLILHDGLMDGRIRRVLVVCPKSIEEKWHSTLRREFRINNCSKARSGKDLINWLEGETNGTDVLVTSFDKGRGPSVKDEDSKVIDDIETMLEESTIEQIDLVIFDEVHRLIGYDGKRIKRRLADVLSLSSLSRVGLTATPVWNGPDDIREISQILRPLVMENSDADTMISIQSRFTIAVNALKSAKSSDDELQQALDPLSGIEELEDLREEIDKAASLDPKGRTELALKIGEHSPFSSWITRTRSEEIGSMATRFVPDADIVDLDETPGDEFYDEATGTLQRIGSEREIVEEISGMLNHMNHQLQLSSSPRSFHEHIPTLLSGGHISESSAERARILANRLSNSPRSSKESRLIQILGQISSNPDRRGAVIFTQWVPTFDRLTSDSLNLSGAVSGNRRIRTYHASPSNDDLRKSQIRMFLGHDDTETFPVLICTRILQEGVDLQQSADCIIHYDLPPNPQAVEQRIGRADRLNQPSQTVEVRYVFLRGLGDHDFLLGMRDRIDEFESNVGSMRPILPHGIGSKKVSTPITDEMRKAIEKWNLDKIAGLDLTGFKASKIPSHISQKVPSEISNLSREVVFKTMQKCWPPGSIELRGDAILIDTNGNHLAADPITKSSKSEARALEEFHRAADQKNRIWAMGVSPDGLPKYPNLRRAFLTISMHSSPTMNPPPVVVDGNMPYEAIEFYELVCEHDRGKSIRWVAITHLDGLPKEARISDVTNALISASERGELVRRADVRASGLSSSIIERNEEDLRRSTIIWERQRLMSESRRKFAIAARIESEGGTPNDVQELREEAREIRKRAEELDNRRRPPLPPRLRLVIVRE